MRCRLPRDWFHGKPSHHEAEPHEGEHFTDQGWRFEVVDMDGRRIDKLLVSREGERE